MRVDCWESRLLAVIYKARDKEFQFGIFDCCIFAADCVQAITNKEVLSEFRGNYRNRAQAARLIRNLSYINFEDAVRKVMEENKWNEILKTQLQRGDIAFVRDSNNFKALAVVDFSGINLLLPKSTKGLARIPVESAITCWGIR